MYIQTWNALCINTVFFFPWRVPTYAISVMQFFPDIKILSSLILKKKFFKQNFIIHTESKKQKQFKSNIKFSPVDDEFRFVMTKVTNSPPFRRWIPFKNLWNKGYHGRGPTNQLNGISFCLVICPASHIDLRWSYFMGFNLIISNKIMKQSKLDLYLKTMY